MAHSGLQASYLSLQGICKVTRTVDGDSHSMGSELVNLRKIRDLVPFLSRGGEGGGAGRPRSSGRG